MKYNIIQLTKREVFNEFVADFDNTEEIHEFIKKLTTEEMATIAEEIQEDELLWDTYYKALRDIVEELHPEIKELS